MTIFGMRMIVVADVTVNSLTDILERNHFLHCNYLTVCEAVFPIIPLLVAAMPR